MKKLFGDVSTVVTLIAACVCAGCATTGTNGVVDIGNGIYMVGGLGSAFEHSGSAVKAKYFQVAKEYCDAKHARMIPVYSTGQDAVAFQYASAEVQFRCVADAAPR